MNSCQKMLKRVLVWKASASTARVTLFVNRRWSFASAISWRMETAPLAQWCRRHRHYMRGKALPQGSIIKNFNLVYQGNFTETDRVVVEAIYDAIQKQGKKFTKQVKLAPTWICLRKTFFQRSLRRLSRGATSGRWTPSSDFLKNHYSITAWWKKWRESCI